MAAHLLLERADGEDPRSLASLAALVRSGGGEFHVFGGGDSGLPEGVLIHAKDGLAQAGELVRVRGLVPDDCTLAGASPEAARAAKTGRLRFARLGRGAWPAELGDPEHAFDDLSGLETWFAALLRLEACRSPIATVGGLVFRPDGRALFVRTPKWSGRWGVPGGKIEYGEGHLDAFVREIREETGLSARQARLVLVQEALEDPDFYRPRHFLLLNLVAHVDDAPVQLNHESVESGWFSLVEALALDLNRPTRSLVEHLFATGGT